MTLTNNYAQLQGVQGLAVMVSQDPVAAVAAACDAGRELVEQRYWSDDIFVMSPADGKWSIHDLRSQLASQENLVALGAIRVIVVEDAHTMDGRMLDSLLKTVEEPRSSTLFIFTADSFDSLPATIQGRAISVITAPERSVEDIQHLYSSAGVDLSADLAEFVQISKVVSQAPASSYGNIAEGLFAVQEALKSQEGFLRGFRVLRALELVLEASVGVKSSSTQGKALMGGLVRSVLFWSLKTEFSRLRSGDSRASGRIERIERALEMLSLHVSREQVLVYAYKE